MKESGLYRTVAILLLIISIVIILYFGRVFLLPLTLAGVISMLFIPLANKLEQMGLGRSLSTAVCVLIIIIASSILMGLVALQLASISEQMPEIKKEFSSLLEQSHQFISDRFNIDYETQEARMKEFAGNAGSTIQQMLGSGLSIISNSFLTLIYIILLLLQRERLFQFVLMLTSKVKKAEEIIEESVKLSTQYLIGKGLTILALGIFYAVGFLVAGIPFGILLAVIGALLSIIPYVGNIIAAGIAFLLAIVGGGGLNSVIWIVVIMSIAQLVESYLLLPKVVGERVNINALTTIITVVGFGIIWGAVGAILAIPLTGIAKILFDNYKPLHPFGFLLGDQSPEKASK